MDTRIKDVTRALLMIEPERDEKLPCFVHHPVFQNDMAFDGERLVDLFENLEAVRKPYLEMIDKAERIEDCLIFIRDPYKMLWFSLIAPCLNGERYAEILKYCWMCEEYPSRDTNVPMDEMVRLFEAADEQYMVPDWLPETLTIYRGVRTGSHGLGMSWSLEEEVARKFASRFSFGEDKGVVYKLEVPRDAVLAYIDERGESEIVIDAREFEGEVSEVK